MEGETVPIPPMTSILQTLETLIGASRVVPWEAVNSSLQTQIGQAIAQSTPDCVVYPSTVEEFAAVVACAKQNHWRLLPCGQGTKLHWGGLAQNIQIVVSTARLNQLIEHASGDLTVTAEAGLSLATLQHTLATAGQFLPVDPAYPDQATLGGIVATADTGALRQRYGGIRDLLIGLSLVRSDGQIARAGGRVVKNVAGYDLMKLMTGSYGTLGILTQLTFRIYPLPATAATVVLTGDAVTLEKIRTMVLASALTPTSLDLLSSAWVKQLGLGAGMGLVARFQSMDVSVAQQVQQLVQAGESSGLMATTLQGDDDANLWRQLQAPMPNPPQDAMITCKIGIAPDQTVAALNRIETLSAAGLVNFHAGSGLGALHLPLLPTEALVNLRQFCQAHSGFLTVLAAPTELKQQIDIWGASGNALPLMQRLKAQFDPNDLLSPRRFIGGI